MADERRQPSPGAWAVLALASEGATHGFAIARALQPGGEVGAVFALTRLQEPVEHVRDWRIELLLKRLFLARAGGDPRPLLTAQRRRFTDIVSALKAKEDAADFVRAWRLASARAALDFVDDQLARAQRRTVTL